MAFFFFFFFLLRSLPRARLLHSQSGRVGRRSARGRSSWDPTGARLLARCSASLRFGEGVARRLGAGEPRRSHGSRELHGAAEPGAAGGGERDAGRAPAQRRRPRGGGGARGPGHRCPGPRHQGTGAPGHLPRGGGGGRSPLISACGNFPAGPAQLHTREREPLFPGRDRSGSERGGGSQPCRGSPGEATAPSAVIKPSPGRAAHRAFLHALPVGATQPETHGLRGGVGGRLTPRPGAVSPRPRFLTMRTASCRARTWVAAWRTGHPWAPRRARSLSLAVPGETGVWYPALRPRREQTPPS